MSFNHPLMKRSRSASVDAPLGEGLPRRCCLDNMPGEVLGGIFLCCSAGDLQGLRMTARIFRTHIDAENHLDQAVRRAALPLCNDIIAGLGDLDMFRMGLYLPNSLLPLPSGGENPSYMLMLAGGLCSVCGKYAGGPPYSSNLRVRLCGENDCLARVCSDISEYTYPVDFSQTPNDQHWLAAWFAQVPYINSLENINRAAVHPSDPHCELNRCRYLRAEFDQFSNTDAISIWAPAPELPPWECPQELALKRHEALEPIHYALCAWRYRAEVKGRQIREKNLETLEKYAAAQGRSMEDVLSDPLIQRVLAAHARDLACAYPSTFTHLRVGKGPPQTQAGPAETDESSDETRICDDGKTAGDQLSNNSDDITAMLLAEPSSSAAQQQLRAAGPSKSSRPRSGKTKAKKGHRHNRLSRFKVAVSYQEEEGFKGWP